MQRLPDEVLFDTRLLDRHIRKGLITREQLEEHLRSIDDVAEQADALAFEELQEEAAPEETSGGNGAEEPLDG